MTQSQPPLRTVDGLVAAGLLAPGQAAAAETVAARYAVAVTPHLAALIDPADPDDPIARQFLPDPRELTMLPEETADPIGDHAHSPVPGLVHRYPDRVLLKVIGVCPVYCRFCFRREMVGPELGETPTPDDLAPALAYIAATPAVWEVILTGGDPLMLSARRIADLTARLAAIPHVQVLRWHTRVPVADPARVTGALAEALRCDAAGKAVYVAVHVNHPRELTADAANALGRLADRGVPLLSQSVLLRGVNDDATTMEALLRRLTALRVTPYYLHHGDLAPGTSHLRTSIADGMALMDELRRRLSGLALPSYVIDIPGGAGKVPVAPPYVVVDTRLPDGRMHYRLTDARGVSRPYLDHPAAAERSARR